MFSIGASIVRELDKIPSWNYYRIYQEIKRVSQECAANLGANPVICWIRPAEYADESIRCSLARYTDCEVRLAISEEEALNFADKHNCILFIFNLSCYEDSEAGFSVLEKLRENGHTAPYLVYTTWGKDEQYESRIIKAGGFACTYHEKELLAAVYAALKVGYESKETAGC